MSQDSEIVKKALRVNAAYKKVFGSDEGELVLADLMNSFNFFSSTYVNGDPQGTAFHEGARAAVLRIIDTVNVDATKYMKMMEEVNQEVFDD